MIGNMKDDRETRCDKESTTVVSASFFRELQIEFLLHELKDPFSVIEAGVRSLLEKRDKFGPLSQRQERALLRILRNTTKTKGMLNSLLEVGRSEAGTFRCCTFYPVQSVCNAIMDALETTGKLSYEELGAWKGWRDFAGFLHEHGVSLNVSARIEGKEMVQDEPKFCQIVGNLLKNALHHRERRVHIDLDLEGDIIAVLVQDDGPGIDPKHRELVFRRYAQIHSDTIQSRKGHGLGLAGARILARRLGGDVVIVSGKEKGAAFRLTLPLELQSNLTGPEGDVGP
ncbi:MAG: sensor histidine kinase [Deltaproteobacteria bacterium]|nr:sensor histidine kinase [Deltaproteobacteria bacterium]